MDAVAEAVSVSTEVVVPFAGGVAGLVLNVAVTPLGKPLAFNVTAELKLLWLVMVIVLVPLPPRKIFKVVGLAFSIKFPSGFTVSASVVLALKAPEMPVTVTVAVPTDAEALAVSVRVLVLVAGLGLNAAVTPLGKPEADRVTLPLKPFAGVMVIVLVPCVPCVMVRPFGLADSV